MAELPYSGTDALCFERDLHVFDLLGHIDHLLKEKDPLAGNYSFLICIERPEALLEIIALGSAETMDVSICAMVIGYNKSLVRNDAACTSELH